MIVRDRPSGLRLFLILRGSILNRIRAVLLVNVLVAIAVTITHGALFELKITLTAIPFTLIGLPLAIFLGFRNTAAYDRYWEGRKLWGELVFRSQNLARQCRSLISASRPASAELGLDDVRVRMISRAIVHAYALRDRLRSKPPGAAPDPALLPLLSTAEWEAMARSSNPPATLLLRMGDDLAECVATGRIDGCRATSLDDTFSAMAAVAAACDRIRTTPIPFSYTLLLHRTAYLYCFLLPFGLVDTIGFMTPFVVGIVAYTFFGLDALGDEIEEPFGTSANDLPLDAICRNIEISLKEAIDHPDIPAPLAPVGYCLL
ncbi:bestrophin [Cupriavidus respiraculi]|uniref:bestrophin family protein n=1 Tax=Cupriavidus respiraculi TaxID=195930 RepID=UPI001C93E154|nr:bestrophin family ion channel [Cupriavidus respiraculi]MBY4948079.1 bestrophin [Cupriavidus respiraculi]